MTTLFLAVWVLFADETATYRGPGFTVAYPAKSTKLDPPSARVPFQLEYRKNTLVRLETERLTQPIDLSDESFAAIFLEVQLERLHERVTVPLTSQSVKRYPWGTGIEFVYVVPARSGKKNERDRVIEVVTTVEETLYRFTTWIPERDLSKVATPMAEVVASFRPERAAPAAATQPAFGPTPGVNEGLAALLVEIQEYRRRIQESGASAEAQAALAESLGLRGYLTESMTEAELAELQGAAAAAVRLAPADVDSQRARGWAAFHRKQMVEMEGAIQEALRIAPNDAVSHVLYALWYGFNPERSEAMARKAIEADPDLAVAYFVKALADRRAGDLPESRQALERAMALDPGFLRAKKELAEVLYESGDTEAALAAYRALAKELPRDFTVQFRLAVVARKQGLIDEAVSGYQAAIALDPSLPEAHYNLAVLLLQEKQRPDLAARSFQRFLELDPESERAETVRKWLKENGY
jgi:tetratricopeptide (TPR) repeat protein